MTATGLNPPGSGLPNQPPLRRTPRPENSRAPVGGRAMNSLSWARSASVAVIAAVLAVSAPSRSEGADTNSLADQLRQLDGRVVPADGDLGKQLPRMLSQHARAGLRAANGREYRAWSWV